MKYKFFFVTFLPIFVCFSNIKIDSLLNVFNKISKNKDLKSDTTKHKILLELGIYYQNSNFDSSIYFYNKSLQQLEKLKIERPDIYFKFFIVNHLQIELKKSWILIQNSQNNSTEKYLTEIIKKIDYHINKSRNIRIKNQFYLLKASAYSHFGIFYSHINEYIKSLNYYYATLEIYDRLNIPKEKITILTNIGVLYDDQRKYDKAISIYKKALFLAQKNKNLEEISNLKGNIGSSYFGKDDFKKALIYFKEALEISKKTNNLKRISLWQGNIGAVYSSIGHYKEAIQILDEAVKTDQNIGNKSGVVIHLGNIGFAYYELKYYNKAEKILLEALKIDKLINYTLHEEYILTLLTKLYEENGNYKKALELHKKSIILRDSILSQENKDALFEKEVQYQYDKKKIVDSVAFAKQTEIKNSQIKAKQNQQIGLVFILLLISIFSFFLYKRYKLTKKQKIVIEQQKTEAEIAHHNLEEKNREILESITYAKRIQSAILPQAKLVKEFLEDSFVLYKPKDIVAGDFYWLEVVGDTVLFAAADCTGHGVPGAMVSVVCNNGLNRAVREDKLYSPDLILNKTRELVVQEFEKSDENVMDGMDISLCALNTQTNVLQWAGANNPLWILRNGVIIEYKADKQPIGKYSNAKPFSLIEFQLEKNDIIYIFTDGYQDQFGGAKEKKFRVAQMRELFLSLTSKTMEEQRKIIGESFEVWKGELEQIDDVCVIGVRI